jgi:hypothetical protein
MYDEDKDFQKNGCEGLKPKEERSWSRSWTVDCNDSGDVTPAKKEENSLTTNKEM